MAWHSVVIVILPTILSLLVLYLHRSELIRNWSVVAVSLALSAIQGRPEVQALFSVWGRESEGLFAHAAPVFAILYLLFGRFRFPSIRVAWAGTCLCLLVTDASVSYFWWRTEGLDVLTLLHGVGGAGWADGLLWLPLGAAGISGFATYWLKRGHDLPEMLGRRWYLAEITGNAQLRNELQTQSSN
jgi:hypothetical protein